MPQGNFKSKKNLQIPSKSNQKHKKNSLKLKKGKNTGISSKKTCITESQKLRKQLERAINERIEDETKALATKGGSSFKILKSDTTTKGKKKK